ncbi:MAG: hypothetical protein EPO20_13265 [Betaproteobacteria bacterium]|nr:MAG: hypothetical protein EPO20_13265 [Betaproteobacteria bacterium]
MFCIVKGQEKLGLAKVIDTSGNTWTVEYFDSPEPSGREVHRVAKSRVTPRKLGANTRLYHYDVANRRWLVGRVVRDEEDSVEVRFAKRTDVSLNHEHVFVRWKKPISDPVVYLSHLVTETPQYAEGRSIFLESYVAQRAASWGISALLSSIIELEPHQINVVRRVLSDASQRYLLADEVGLGKTIEAGVIIRQAVLDDPKGHRIVVLVPASLIQQWRGELILRFGLRDFLDDSVWVLPQEMSSELSAVLQGATLLVIDEAHHLASASDAGSGELYDVIREAAHSVQRLLLLSATPALRNERGFHRMLHLLDPVVYDLDDEASFREKIAHRQTLAEAVASLEPQNVLQLDWVLEDLLEKLPNDARLGELVNALRSQLTSLPSEDDPALQEAIRLLRAHLSETYRLHRRILRNRRKHIKFLTPERKGARVVVAQGSRLAQLESAIEAWRMSALASTYGSQSQTLTKELAKVYWLAVSALVEHPLRLTGIFKKRREALTREARGTAFEGERELIEEILRLADAREWLESRLEALSNAVKPFLDNSTKVVVFCSEHEVAESVFASLARPLGGAVVRLLQGQDEESEPPWLQFLSKPNVKVIVCDSRAQEGLNLQGGNKVIIHFDLPVSPNWMEQRLGRVDRYGSGAPIESVVLVDQGSQYQKGWFDLMDHGLGVFNRSIASLQYLVEQEFQTLGELLFAEGLEALASLTERLAGEEGGVSKELKLIDEQDGLDELAPLAEQETGSIEEVDGDWKRIRDAFLRWVVETLMFAKIPLANSQTQAGIDSPFRFQYQKPDEGGTATLIPLSGFLFDFIGALDYDAPGANSTRPRSYPYCSHRRAAINARVHLLRYGDNFVEAVRSFSELDDRGRSFAMWRQLRSAGAMREEEIRMYFRFEFLVETCLEQAYSILAGSSSFNTDAARSAAARRADSLFPPVVYRVWVDEEGQEPDPDFVRPYLAPPYAKEGVVGRYIDTNLNSSRIHMLARAMPDAFASWADRCTHMRRRAHEVLLNREELAARKGAALARAETEDDVRYAQLRTRMQTLRGKEAEKEGLQLRFEKHLNQALYEGIAQPSIKVDVIGVVFLSLRSFSSVEKDAQAYV